MSMFNIIKGTVFSISAYVIEEEESGRISVIFLPLARGTGSEAGAHGPSESGKSECSGSGMSHENGCFLYASSGQHPKQNPGTHRN
jgi:hypothetical protein